jgi:tetratricopeptide (TPR) repeat protein
MHRMIQVMGLMDSFRGKNKAIKSYQEKLYSYREQEAETLIDMGVLYLDQDKSEDALKHFYEALNTYEKMEYEEGKAFTHDMIGDTYLNDRETSNALKHYQKAHNIYISIGSPLAEDMSEKIEEVKQLQDAIDISAENKADLDDESYEDQYEENNPTMEYEETSEQRESQSTSSKSEQISVPATMDKIADKLETAIMLLDNSSMYEMYYKEENGIEYLQEALNTADVIEDWEGQGTLHLMLGDSQLKLEKVDDALKHFEKAYEIFENNSSNLGEAVSLLLLGTVFFIQNKKSNMYKLFKNAMEIFQELNYKPGEKVAISLLEMLSS